MKARRRLGRSHMDADCIGLGPLTFESNSEFLSLPLFPLIEAPRSEYLFGIPAQSENSEIYLELKAR